MSTEKCRDAINDDFLRDLTYFDLCVVPSFIQPYLSRFDFKELKTVFFMFMQTFLEINPDHSRFNSSCTEFGTFMREHCKRPLPKQLIYLLQSTIAYYINCGYPLHQFFLKIDSNTEVSMIQLQKVILTELIENKSVKDKYWSTLSFIVKIFDLVQQLHEIQKGNSKFLLNLNNKVDNADQFQEFYNQRSFMIFKLKESLQNISNEDTNTSQFYQFCHNLMMKYDFVVLQRTQKQPKKEEDNQLQCKSSQKQYIVAQDAQQYFNVNENINFIANQTAACEFLIATYINILKNVDSTTIPELDKLSNTILVMINQLCQQRKDDQIMARSTLYCLSLSIRILRNLKLSNTNQIILIEEVEIAFKDLMALHLCSMKSTYLFLFTYLHLNFQDDGAYTRIISLIGWVMAQYRKYNFKNEELIYADFIASHLDLLTSWKAVETSSKRGQEISKQSQILIIKLASKSKTYGQKDFGVFFEMLNIKMLKYFALLLLKAKSTQFKTVLPQDLQNVILSAFRARIFESFPQMTNQYFDELGSRSKELQNAEQILLYTYFIIESKCQGSNLFSSAFIIYIKLYNLAKIMSNSCITPSIKNALQNDKTNKCLLKCTSELLAKINILLMEYTTSSNKKNQVNPISTVAPNQNVQATAVIDRLLGYMVFLYLVYYSIDPINNEANIIYALVINSYCVDEIDEEKILRVYQEAFKDSNVVGRKRQAYDYNQILKYSKTYDVLECFYVNFLKKQREKELRWLQIKMEYEEFCRSWCKEQNNYQWLSEQKKARLRLILLREICLKIEQEVA